MAALAMGAAAAGCDQGKPALSSGGKGPAPQVVWKYPTNPDGTEASGVPASTSVRVQFDRFLAPDSTVRQAVCIQAASAGPGTPSDLCVAGIVPEYDPVDRVVVWKGAQLLPNQRYNVRLFVPADDNDPTGIRAFDGVPLAEVYEFAFKTANPAATSGPDAPNPAFQEPSRAINFCSTSPFCPAPQMLCDRPTPSTTTQGPKDYLGTNCLGAGCHSPGMAKGISGSAFPLTAAGAGSAGVPAVIRDLVDHATVATESATGPDPSVPRRSAKDVFGVNMPYIDATIPGNSFLLYKLILAMPPRCPFDPNEESAAPGAATVACTATGYGPIEGFSGPEYKCSALAQPPSGCTGDAGAPPTDAGVAGLMGARVPPIVDAWVPDAQWKPPAAGEYDRLRGRIRGDAMPLGYYAARQNVLALGAWIAAGAQQPASCP